MKTFVMIIALTFTMTTFAEPLISFDPPGPTIGIQIEIGRKKLDCLKFGLCKISIVWDLGNLFGNYLTAAEDRVAYGYATATGSSGMSIRLVKEYMTQETLTEFFGNGEFIVGEDFYLPDDVTKALGLKRGYIIPEGVYKCTENSKEIILNL